MKSSMKSPSYPNLVVVLTVLPALALPRSGWAQFNFITNADNTITITGYTGSGGDVTITNIINGYSVTAIGDYAFYNHTNLTTVTIPAGVTSVGFEAFASCSGLTSVTISDSVTSIRDGAFAESGLTRAAIPKNVTNIGEAPFANCPGLTNIDVDAANPSFIIGGGVLFNEAMTRLVQCPAGLQVGTYAIPNSVTSIDYSAFQGCDGLTSVTIPDSVTSLGESMFWGCSGLTNVTIGNRVTTIEDEAFFGCSSLTTVTIPDSVALIGGEAFQGCDGLTSVTIPDSVTYIGSGAFADCSSLMSVTIGNSVSFLGWDVFNSCSGLTNIAVNTDNLSYASAGGVLFNKTLTTLIQFPGGLAGSYAIPESVMSLGYGAFENCSGLTNVTIGNSVTSIGGFAFGGCSGLTTITIPASVTDIYGGTFHYCTNLHQAYFQGNAPNVVPFFALSTLFQGESGTVYYVPGTAGWGATYGGWPTAPWYQPRPQILGSGYGFGVQSNRFGFTISWATNTAVVVEASTNLHDWTAVSTNTLVNGTNLFWDSTWTNYPQRFYRVGVEQ